MNRNSMILLGLAVIAGLGLSFAMKGGDGPKGVPLVVKVPELSAEAMTGHAKFEANCKRCHGANAAGSKNGPPLVHKIYETGHHSDLSFQRAVKFGVRAHHWSFGNMPPLAGVSEDDVGAIIVYVRELQSANGIF